MKAATLKLDIWTQGRKKLPDDHSDLAELLAPHADHVADLLSQGYQCGEIVDDRFGGWWTIEETEPHRQSAKTAAHRRYSTRAAR